MQARAHKDQELSPFARIKVVAAAGDPVPARPALRPLPVVERRGSLSKGTSYLPNPKPRRPSIATRFLVPHIYTLKALDNIQHAVPPESTTIH